MNSPEIEETSEQKNESKSNWAKKKLAWPNEETKSKNEDKEKDTSNQEKRFFPSLEQSRLAPQINQLKRLTDFENTIEKANKKESINYQTKDFLVDKFIGEFTTDKHFKIIRAYIDQNDSDRIFYTKFEPTDFSKKINILIIHGYGHSGSFLEVY